MIKKLFLILSFSVSFLYAQINFSKIVDLTYTLDDETIYWPTEAGFKLEAEYNGTTEKGYHYSSNKFSAPEHGGTHLDAPIHFYEKGNTTDEINLEKLMGNAVVVDISEKADKNRDYEVKKEDFIDWEKSNGRIPDSSIVIIKTGMGKSWPDRIKYLGTDIRGAEGVAKLHFPGLHYSGAEWLINERKLKAVGIETASIDYGQSTHFETHQLLCKNGIPILENVANVDKLPVKGFTIIALPMKIKGGSGGPTRIIAIL